MHAEYNQSFSSLLRYKYKMYSKRTNQPTSQPTNERTNCKDRRLKSTSCSYYRLFRYGSCWYSFSIRRTFSKMSVRANVVCERASERVNECVQNAAVDCVHIISTLKSNLFCNPSKYCAFYGKFSIMCIMFARDVLADFQLSWNLIAILKCVKFLSDYILLETF